MGRAPCCDKANVKKGPWSPEEDAKLKDYIHKHGTGGNWIALPQKVGLRRCGKSCRLRWLNYLRPNIKHGEFSDDEDRIICTLFASIGSRWSIIAAQLPGRTDNDIKNYWNTKLKKKLILNCSSIPPISPSPIYNNNQNPKMMMMRSHQPTMYPSPPNPNPNPNHSSFLYPPNSSSSPYQQYNHHHNNPNFTSLISADSIGGPDGPAGPARGGFEDNINHDHDGAGDDGLLVFGGGGDHDQYQDQDLLRPYLRNNNHIDDDDENHNNKFLFSTSNGYSSSSSASAAGINGCSSLSDQAPVLDYSIDEIKQLISTHNNNINININNFNFFVDDCTIKTEQGN